MGTTKYGQTARALVTLTIVVSIALETLKNSRTRRHQGQLRSRILTKFMNHKVQILQVFFLKHSCGWWGQKYFFCNRIRCLRYSRKSKQGYLLFKCDFWAVCIYTISINPSQYLGLWGLRIEKRFYPHKSCLSWIVFETFFVTRGQLR